MREIKYRQPTYDEKTKKPFGFHYWGIVDGKITPPLAALHNGHIVGEEHQEFTGLKDKNGKEIYEGDIVSIDGGADSHNAKIIFKDGCFGLDMKAAEGEYHFAELKYYIDMNFCTTEIIGNIHKNSELLET